jgi:hypothetical protein
MRRFISYSRGCINLTRLFIFIAIILAVTYSHAQILYTATSFNKTNQDSASLLHAFTKGKTDARFRYFFMATMNEDSLTNYFANAAGGALKFETAPFHRFQFGMGGFFTFNVASSDWQNPIRTQIFAADMKQVCLISRILPIKKI